MYPRVFPITPTQQATNGALDIFVEGCRKDHVRQQLFGLSVLRHAKDAEVREAMSFVQATQGVTATEIEAMLTR